MYLIIGLGNPEGEYSNTRHNMGFDAINHLSQKLNITVTKEKFKALYGDGMINNEKVILLKPQTYMNLSGEAIIKYKDFYQVQYSSKRKKINKGKKFYTYSNTAQKRTKLGKTCYIRVRACAKYTLSLIHI